MSRSRMYLCFEPHRSMRSLHKELKLYWQEKFNVGCYSENAFRFHFVRITIYPIKKVIYFSNLYETCTRNKIGLWHKQYQHACQGAKSLTIHDRHIKFCNASLTVRLCSILDMADQSSRALLSVDRQIPPKSIFICICLIDSHLA